MWQSVRRARILALPFCSDGWKIAGRCCHPRRAQRLSHVAGMAGVNGEPVQSENRGRGASMLTALALVVVAWPSCLMLSLQCCSGDSPLLGGDVRVRAIHSTGAPKNSPPAAALGGGHTPSSPPSSWQEAELDIIGTRWQVGLPIARRKLLAGLFEGEYDARPRPPYSYEYTSNRGAAAGGVGPAPYGPAHATAPAPIRDFGEPPPAVRTLALPGCSCASQPLLEALRASEGGAGEVCRLPFAKGSESGQPTPGALACC